MESTASSFFLFSTPKSPFRSCCLRRGTKTPRTVVRGCSIDVKRLSYHKFNDFALGETSRCVHLQPSSLQVLDYAAFLNPEFDLPIFCTNFFTASATNIVVLDLNPLYDVIHRVDFREKSYKSLMSLSYKYGMVLPWGGKLTHYGVIKAWLEIMNQATEEVNEARVAENREAQHLYLTWRADKDPGRLLLNKLIGDPSAKDLIDSFVFNGIQELGSKTFLDYFPEHQCGWNRK